MTKKTEVKSKNEVSEAALKQVKGGKLKIRPKKKSRSIGSNKGPGGDRSGNGTRKRN
jgi:hypothetical protein